MFVISQALVFGQNVNPDGSFSYSVPIVTPPGTSGMGPNLALSYNSNGGNGFLGVGWSLSGLSTVNRDSYRKRATLTFFILRKRILHG
jgi:hypothetical protein